MPVAFISGLIIAFIGALFGAFFAHLFVSYRQKQQKHQELSSVLAQIAEMEKEQIIAAANAAEEADNMGTVPTEIVHEGSRLWRLHERVYEIAEPIYPDLPTDCKENIWSMNKWIIKLRDGSGTGRMPHQYITGGAGGAHRELEMLNFGTFLKQYFYGRRETYPSAMELRERDRQEAKDMLEYRQQEFGYQDEEEEDGESEPNK